MLYDTLSTPTAAGAGAAAAAGAARHGGDARAGGLLAARGRLRVCGAAGGSSNKHPSRSHNFPASCCCQRQRSWATCEAWHPESAALVVCRLATGLRMFFAAPAQGSYLVAASADSTDLPAVTRAEYAVTLAAGLATAAAAPRLCCRRKCQEGVSLVHVHLWEVLARLWDSWLACWAARLRQMGRGLLAMNCRCSMQTPSSSCTGSGKPW